MKKVKLSFWQIWNMNFGFLGIQFSYGLQQSNMSAIYKYLGASEGEIPILWLAGPVTGLLVQPIIGTISDGTWSPRFGRRKPFFLIGAIAASIALFLMPYSNSLFMAASLLWILDAGNNIAMEPYRAFVSDKLKKSQHSLGYLMQSFFTGLGTTVANFTPAILISLGLFAANDKMLNGIPETTYWAFTIGAAVSIISILVTITTTKEIPPTEEELKKLKEEKEKDNIFKRTFNGIGDAFMNMPLTMRQLIPVMFFNWFAMFCYWQYITSSLSLSLYGTLDENSEAFNQSQVLTGQVNGTYNIICFLVAFSLVPIAKKYGAKYVHSGSLFIGGLGLLSIPFLSNTTLLFSFPNPFGTSSIEITTIYLFTIGLGVAWASMLSMPYQMLAGSIPKEKTGIYMGIFNMYIVIPMIIQIISVQYLLYDLLGNNPINIIYLAGSFLIIASIFNLFVKTQQDENK